MAKTLFICLVSLGMLAPRTTLALHSVEEEMSRLDVQSALIVGSTEVDETPVWAPDGQAIAVQIGGRWLTIDLTSISLERGRWHGDESIGVASPASSTSPITDSLLKKWRQGTRMGERRITLPDGTVIELKLDDVRTEFVTTKPGGKPRTVWRTGLENCHGLSLSPKLTLVAYVCEQNGVIVSKP